MIHYGFAVPFLSLFFVPMAVFVWNPPMPVAIAVGASFFGLVVVGDASARYRALRQVRRWTAGRGIIDIRRCHRGGFVSWGWSVWTFAEINRYRGVDVSGAERMVLGSHLAPVFGLLVFTRCEIRAPAPERPAA